MYFSLNKHTYNSRPTIIILIRIMSNQGLNTEISSYVARYLYKDVAGIVESFIGKTDEEVFRWMLNGMINFDYTKLQTFERMSYVSQEKFFYSVEVIKNITTFIVDLQMEEFLSFNIKVKNRAVGVAHNLIIHTGISSFIHITELLAALGLTFNSLPDYFKINDKLYDKKMYRESEGRIMKRLSRPRRNKHITKKQTLIKFME